MGKRFGGKGKEGAAEVKSQPPKKEGKGEDEVTNTAAAENEGQHDHDGSRKFGQDNASKSGNAGYKRGKQPKMSTSGLLDVSLGVEHNRAKERSGGRKRKSTPRGRKVSEGEVEADAGGDLGKK